MRIKPGLIIKTLKINGSLSKTAEILGINRSTVWRWEKRSILIYGRLRINGLRRFSTKPYKTKERLSFKDKDNIVKLRNLHGYEASKIKHVLNLKVSAMTVHRVIKAKDLVKKYGYHVRPYHQETTHMHLGNTKTVGYLQMDV